MERGSVCGFSVAVVDRAPCRVGAGTSFRPRLENTYASSFVPRRVRWPGLSSFQVPTRGSSRPSRGWQCIDVGFLGGLEETIELLIATAVVVPIFKRLNLSPILGFLSAGVALGPHGLRVITDVADISQIADIGVLFLLFEMGLELSIDRLRKLRVYAFGLGTLQMAFTSAALAAGALFMGAGISEALVVGSSLSLSSSAFVLQLLAERKEQATRYATAAYGILLLQDIAVVPLLVLVPLLSTTEWSGFREIEGLFVAVAATAAKALAAVVGVVVVGGTVLRPVFRFVSESRSSEAFTSVVLGTVLGAGLVTDALGLSMTLGAFIAGVLLSESSYRSKIKVDIEPFRGLLLGLFFITTGMSMDLSVFAEQPVEITALIVSLIGVKASTLALLSLPFNLTTAESTKLGLILGQGGEFGFVIFALANKLGFLPDDVNKILVVVIVSSMALTPAMAEAGARLVRAAL
uniref:Cation/H+ exchanger transmembrane domain-containing protein n=1 Tax=Rhodosorus marinus TaxID=101924 RepID=A0A7S2ZPD3_9RHOD|mmetsp:Transcript_27343/g.106972  ORF Transcript_27343/g.106972 Transcript_27343/m.106972 type:complete len:464 (+) Transcript_27343:314-1705(+)